MFDNLIFALRRVLHHPDREQLLHHARTRSLTPAKRHNERLNEEEYRAGTLELRSLPPTVILGLTNVCNLRCPLCVTGLGLQKKRKGFMSEEEARGILDRVREHALWVQLYKWGESLLHRDFTSILLLAKERGLAVQLSTNFSVPCSDRMLDSFVSAPLDHLIVSLDGLSLETYRRYRVGGDFDRVVDNVRRLVRIKKERKALYPVIDLQFLVNRFNEGEVGQLEGYARAIGVDFADTADTILPFKRWDAETARAWLTEEDRAARKYLDIDPWVLGKVCPFLYQFMVVEQDGSVPPCCYATDPEDDFSRFIDSRSLSAIYNSERFVSARGLFRGVASGASPGDDPLACRDCSVLLSYREKVHR